MQRAIDGFTVDEVKGLGEVGFIGGFAGADALAFGLAEGAEEVGVVVVGSAAFKEIHCFGFGGTADFRRVAGGLIDDVEENVGARATKLGV